MTAPPTRRVNRGRGHSYYLDGAHVDGVTTVLKDGIPKPQFEESAAKKTAAYAVDHWDELAEQNLSERYEVLRQARWQIVRQAGERGTEVHTLAHRLAAGEELEIPEPLVGHVDAYLRFAEEWQPRELLAETVVGKRGNWPFMGTLDTIAQLADGRVWLLDFKTAASGIWEESALQLAAYRYADFYLDGDGQEHAMPEVDATGCVWLRADGYDLIPVEAGPESYRVFQYAQQIAKFKREPREAYVGEALISPTCHKRRSTRQQSRTPRSRRH
jgi:hypothetical protein